MTRPQEIIAKKRDGYALTADEIGIFVDGICDGTWADYQISALVMAMFIRGLNAEEQENLTRAMIHSGETLDLSDIGRPIVDKHSTGGVGDKTSLIIAPLAAACGLAVPMISGRGLGHTGGTLDKLESIPGFSVALSTDRFKELLKKNGYAMTGQTGEIAPADKKMYALRDATATVPCMALIVASIMSKKLAEDLDALVLDVKTGSGAFMQNFDDSAKLAKELVETGKKFGVKTQAVVSDMNQPLGKFVGNALEVFECVKILRSETEKEMQPTLDLSVELTARMLVMGGISETLDDAKSKIKDALDSGLAFEKFKENVEVQDGDPRICDDPDMLIEKNLVQIPVVSQSEGFVAEIDTFAIGNSLCEIGGGRMRAEDKIDHSVGYANEVKIGDRVETGQTIGVIYCRNAEQANIIASLIQKAYLVKVQPPIMPELVRTVIG